MDRIDALVRLRGVWQSKSIGVLLSLFSLIFPGSPSRPRSNLRCVTCVPNTSYRYAAAHVQVASVDSVPVSIQFSRATERGILMNLNVSSYTAVGDQYMPSLKLASKNKNVDDSLSRCDGACISHKL